MPHPKPDEHGWRTWDSNRPCRAHGSPSSLLGWRERRRRHHARQTDGELAWKGASVRSTTALFLSASRSAPVLCSFPFVEFPLGTQQPFVTRIGSFCLAPVANTFRAPVSEQYPLRRLHSAECDELERPMTGCDLQPGLHRRLRG